MMGLKCFSLISLADMGQPYACKTVMTAMPWNFQGVRVMTVWGGVIVCWKLAR